MNSEVISREASDSSKGFRLQKIRAIKLMLESIDHDVDSIFFTAIENVEDVSHRTIIDGQEIDYYEEDKNYAKDSSFTLFSPSVINTLVSFFDIFVIKYMSSNSVYLGFYTTRLTGKERKSTLADGTKVDLPDEPILSLLASDIPISDQLAGVVKAVLIEEYESQYKNKKMNGHLTDLKEQTPDQIRLFLSKIRWHFGQENEVELKATVITAIRKSPLHNVSHANKEEIIFSLLMERLEQKQNAASLYEKFINSSDVKLIFKEAESEQPEHTMDPMWMELERLESEVIDKRNLGEKYRSIVIDYPDRKLAHLARKACRSKTEQVNSNKTFLSLKYRVLEACNDHMFESRYKNPTCIDTLDSTVDELVKTSVKSINELKKDYSYTLSNEKLIEGVVLDLFDSCFLAFDENE